MKLRTFKELLKDTKESFDKVLIPIKIRQMKAKAELSLTQLDANAISKEREIHEYLAQDDISFDVLIDKLDEIALLERRQVQYEDVLTQLFPKVKAKKA